ncbi:MAG: imidazole glycerol phosphate synthase subunit HisF [Microbacteriaceae bacterium]|nr:imidazole glycerol phosphate synthase subunit HisF [Microbacteriaceae bacterium]
MLEEDRFVKTIRFGSPKYVGDPVNVLSIFNDFEVDEIVLIDIGAAARRYPLQFKLLERLASEAFVPLAYGGGVSTLADAEELVRIGFEKIIVNTTLIEHPEEVRRMVEALGAQAIVGGVDLRAQATGYEVFTRGGSTSAGLDLHGWTSLATEVGVGEVLATSIDREGTRVGIDLHLTKQVVDSMAVPVIAHGGAGTRQMLVDPIEVAGAQAVAAGSQFVMQGSRDSVLINYPTPSELAELFGRHLGTAPTESGGDPRYLVPGRDLTNTKMCRRCIITSDVPRSGLEESEVCFYCNLHDSLDAQYPIGAESLAALTAFAERVKHDAKSSGSSYDCILGVSGGTDSSFLAHTLVGLGVKPLAVHFDNTWNSPTATGNIYAVLSKLGIDLETYVVDNSEYDDIYRSFMLAGVKDIEAPTDIGFMGVLYRAAEKHGIKHIVEGHSFRTEGISPMGWLYMDGGYIEDVQRKYGHVPLKTFPNMSFGDFLRWSTWNAIERTRPLYWMDYRKEDAKKFLTETYGWKWYGGHHLENRFTAFYHTYFLPKRWGINFRQIELSALVRSGQLDRDLAIEQFLAPRQGDAEIIAMVKKRLGFTDEEFDEVMSLSHRTYREFRTYKRRFERLRPLFWFLWKLNRVPRSFYEKFCKP